VHRRGDGICGDADAIAVDIRCVVYVVVSSCSCLCAVYGRDVTAHVEAPLEQEPTHPGRNTVTYEARLLKSLLLQLM